MTMLSDADTMDQLHGHVFDLVRVNERRAGFCLRLTAAWVDTG